jgi:4-amino-4-deoxy-L-arabinose transferase-like glycosyltransferase
MLPPWLRRGGPLLAILLVGALVRVAYVAATADDPRYRAPTPGLDIDLHLQAARELGLGPEDGPPIALMMASTPAYPALLALLMQVVGDQLLGLRLAQGLLSLLLPVGLYLAGRRVRDRGAGLAAAGLWALYAPLVHFDVHLEKSVLELGPLALALALLFLPAATTGRQALVRGLGLGVALAIMTASQLGAIIVAATVLLAVLVFQPGARRLRLITAASALVLVLGVLGGIQAWRHAQPEPVCRAQTGVHVRVGFHHGAHGAYSRVESIPAYPYGHVFHAHMVAELAEGRRLDDAASNGWHVRQAWAWIRDHAGPATGMLLRKLRLVVSDFEAKGNDFFPDLVERVTLLRYLPVSFGVLLMLAMLGLLVLATRPPEGDAARWRPRRAGGVLALVLAACMLPALVTFVTWRYRLPMVVPMLLLAGVATAEVVARLGRWLGGQRVASRRELGASLAVLALAGLATFWPAPADVVSEMRSVSARNLGDSVRAETDVLILASVESRPASVERLRKRAELLIGLTRYREAYQASADYIAAADPVSDANVVASYLRLSAWLGRSERLTTLLARLTPRTRQEVYQLVGPTELAWLRRFAGLPERP